MTTNDFELWLNEKPLTDYEDVYDLYRSVKEEASFGIWNFSKNGERLFINESGDDYTLMILSEKAKCTFLEELEKKYCANEGIKGWYYYCCEMNKDN